MNANARGCAAADVSRSERQEDDGRTIEPIRRPAWRVALNRQPDRKSVQRRLERQLRRWRHGRKTKSPAALARRALLIRVMRMLVSAAIVTVCGSVLMYVD
jgi:hypothetical protein